MEQKIFVTKATLPPIEEYVREIESIWETHQLTNMGEKHRALQNELKEYLGVKGLELFANGHLSLELSLQALNLQGEIITTPFTFASTTHAIVRNGLTPVFADIEPDYFTLDPKCIEALITDRTVAIMPVHVYGNPCQVEEIERIAKRHELKVIYDAAHAFGVSCCGKGIGSFGDVSCFSFHATKVFNTIEGGAACFNDPELESALYRLKNFGIKNEECVDGVGANAKLSEFAAAMGLCNLRHIDEAINRRRQVWERYLERLTNVPGLKLTPPKAEVTYNYAYFPLVVEEQQFGATRAEVIASLNQEGIFPRRYFYPLTSSFECFHRQFDVNKTPAALHISRRIITLPIYPELPLATVDKIAEIILGCQAW